MDAVAVKHYLAEFARILTYRGKFPITKVVLVLVWFFTLWSGEKRSFSSSTDACQWHNWEDWPADATPHHVVLLADPQLVDPHTYPGRPWPLDRLTVAHTDQYLRRGYQSIEESLDPDSVIFLGDLFDGGREWWTGRGEQPADKTWKKYGESFWLREYERWGKIFLHDNGQTRRSGDHPRGDRKVIASLPGNHDLGISSGVRLDVRQRFAMFFGEGNRVDVIGNHSFVSVDTVSLTAKALEGEERAKSQEIWKPTEAFLDSVQVKKTQALERYLNGKQRLPENPRLEHFVYDIDSAGAQKPVPVSGGEASSADVPTILLTHVPLYRDEGTPCGPMREKYPPSKGSTADAADQPVKDLRNAISLHAGYQYQNVLHPDITKELMDKVGNVAHVFSGDDHDYCEVVHKGYTSSASSAGGGIREITVKSMSWAMGVRKPGFLLASLWNPIDEHGQAIGSTNTNSKGGPQTTIQTHLCILPDVLGTFIRYGELFLLTIAVLVAMAVRGSGSGGSGGRDARADDTPLLPLRKNYRFGDGDSAAASNGNSASSSISDSTAIGLASRSGKSNRTASPGGGWAVPVDRVDPDPIYSPLKGKFDSARTSFLGASSSASAARGGAERGGGSGGRRTLLQEVVQEVRSGLLQVGTAGLLFYYWTAKSF